MANPGQLEESNTGKKKRGRERLKRELWRTGASIRPLGLPQAAGGRVGKRWARAGGPRRLRSRPGRALAPPAPPPPPGPRPPPPNSLPAGLAGASRPLAIQPGPRGDSGTSPPSPAAGAGPPPIGRTPRAPGMAGAHADEDLFRVSRVEVVQTFDAGAVRRALEALADQVATQQRRVDASQGLELQLECLRSSQAATAEQVAALQRSQVPRSLAA